VQCTAETAFSKLASIVERQLEAVAAWYLLRLRTTIALLSFIMNDQYTSDEICPVISRTQYPRLVEHGGEDLHNQQ
jgi:hypothetical protein